MTYRKEDSCLVVILIQFTGVLWWVNNRWVIIHVGDGDGGSRSAGHGWGTCGRVRVVVDESR